MFWGNPFSGNPLTEWAFVTKQTNDEAGTLAHSFTVSSDGTVFEATNRFVFTSTITRTELKILDLLVDQINREPIPQEHPVFPPDGDGQDHFLSLNNDPFESAYTLFSDDPAGRSYATDDKLDFLEIAALNAYLGYLDHKYGPTTLPPVLPPDTVL